MFSLFSLSSSGPASSSSSTSSSSIPSPSPASDSEPSPITSEAGRPHTVRIRLKVTPNTSTSATPTAFFLANSSRATMIARRASASDSSAPDARISAFVLQLNLPVQRSPSAEKSNPSMHICPETLPQTSFTEVLKPKDWPSSRPQVPIKDAEIRPLAGSALTTLMRNLAVMPFRSFCSSWRLTGEVVADAAARAIFSGSVPPP
mmetsp:Transcript_126921/g.219954  ORF Transcript_126921/g.219954 Transcript_126921/m.219954 type:complete len:204 (-) Transcript_126921:186-797(-)